MIRRWLIRALALALLTLCVVAWVGSYWRDVLVYFYWKNTIVIDVDINWGRVRGTLEPTGGSVPHAPWGWDTIRASNWHVRDSFVDYKCLGFAWTYKSQFGYTQAMVPLWFPTLLAASLLWFVWRKTPAKPETQRGFPVRQATVTDATQSPPK